LNSEGSIAAVGTDLGHEEGLVAKTFQSLPQPVFRFTAIVFPAAIEEIYTCINSAVNDFDGGLFAVGGAEMVAAKAKRRDFRIGLSETA
jgi:hypothetical protein